jgi:acetyl esterase/lipase
MIIARIHASRTGAVHVIAAILAFAVPQATAQVRPEIIPIESASPSGQELLTGKTNIKPALIAGELRIPPGTSRVPAVVLIHGSGALNVGSEQWAKELNDIGAAAFLVDSFAGRGIKDTVTDQTQLDSLAMMVDAYRALGILAKHSRIDPSRIAVMGFSKGAVAAVYSSNKRFRKLLAADDLRFAAHFDSQHI